jgi:hypothetical protein
MLFFKIFRFLAYHKHGNYIDPYITSRKSYPLRFGLYHKKIHICIRKRGRIVKQKFITELSLQYDII